MSTRAAAETLAGELNRGFPAWPVASRIAILSETLPADAAVQRRLVAVQDRLATVTEELRRQAATSAEALGALLRQVAVAQEGTERAGQGLAAVREQVSALDSPLRHLEEVVRGTAIFFDVDSDHYATRRTPRARWGPWRRRSRRRRRACASSARVTVRARLQANLVAARMRTEKVSSDLQALGIAAVRLVTVSTRPPAPLDDQPRSGVNRRVVFELAYPSE